MAEIGKLKGPQTSPVIAHNMRGIEGGKANGNEAINETKTHENYSLIKRGNTVKEINTYRRDLEKEIFHLNRKDLVHAVEYVFQLPRDCPPEQERAFFQACHDFVCEEMLPMGEKCVFVSQVHLDEFYKDSRGNIVTDSDGNVLSKKHLHMMAVPAVPDIKHQGYSWRLCCDQLTKRAVLNSFHSKLQKFIDNYENEKLGITKNNPLIATVLHKKNGSGKTIGLSVKQLKEITAKTGITLDRSITVEDFAKILEENRDIKIQDRKLQELIRSAEIQLKEKEIETGNLLLKLSEKEQKIIELELENRKLSKEYSAVENTSRWDRDSTVKHDDGYTYGGSSNKPKNGGKW